MVKADHPLLALGEDISLDDLRPYPSLALPDNAFPKIQRALQQLGLWTQEVHRSRYSLQAWEGQVLHTHTVGYATAFSLPLFQGEQVALPLATGLDVGDSLVVKRTYAQHPRLQRLLATLRQTAAHLARQHQDVTLLEA